MRKQVTEITCDNCQSLMADEEPHLVKFSVGDHEYATDWCADCHAALLAKLGIDTDALKCDHCDYVAKSVAGKRTHMTRQHS